MMIASHIKSYLRETAGTAAISFGLALPLLVGAIGVSTDLAKAYLVQERLKNAVDAAALAAASASATEAEAEETFELFFDANYPVEAMGDPQEPFLTLTETELAAEVMVRVETNFMSVFGIDYIDVLGYSEIQRQVQGLEVVMVLDNTGSMSSNNNIQSLRTASTNFINILFDKVDDSDDIKIGLVPYSTSVNVGPYGLGVDQNGDYYDEPFVEVPEEDVYEDLSAPYGDDPSTLTYNPDDVSQWHGCVITEGYPDDVTDHSGPWQMYRYDWAGSTSSYYRYYADTYNEYYGPNYICPDQHIIPLTSDQDRLLTAVGDMEANGSTLGNYGMVWGWRVVSPERPFMEAAPYDDNHWRKAVIMMTDGENVMNHAYSAYGKTIDHDVDTGDLNDRFLEICEAMKDEGIIVYTVTFYSGVDEGTKEYYERCATDISKYHDAPSQEDLIEVFENISRELSSLHIKT